VDESLVKLQIWDTAGQERFRSISKAYYRNSHGCIAVYDITKRASFECLEQQLEQYMTYSVSKSSKSGINSGCSKNSATFSKEPAQ